MTTTEPDDRPRPLRALIVDDSPLLRAGIVHLLTAAGVDVVGEATEALDLMRKVRAHGPDVVVINMRPRARSDDRLEAAVEIREKHHGTGVLVLCQQIQKQHVLALIEPGTAGLGYMLGDSVADAGQLVDAMHRVARGGTAFDQEVITTLLGDRDSETPITDLTERELEVLSLMAEGHTNKSIAEKLYIQRRSVEQHVTRIFRKLELDADVDGHRRVLAVLKYLEHA